MDPQFWLERWQNSQIGFHQDDFNTLLMKHWPTLVPTGAGAAASGSEVFLPLCGKSRDMTWLAGEGGCGKVIGVELSRLAIEQFFTDNGLAIPAPRALDGFNIYENGPYELWCGDFFDFPAQRLASTGLCFDRASLIALPEEMRRRYAEKMSTVLPAAAKTLLLTIDYDPSEMDGPPFSVPDDEVATLYAGRRTVERLETRDALEGSENLKRRGLTALTTSVFIIGERIQ